MLLPAPAGSPASPAYSVQHSTLENFKILYTVSSSSRLSSTSSLLCPTQYIRKLQNSVHKCPAPAGSPASPAYSVQHSTLENFKILYTVSSSSRLSSTSSLLCPTQYIRKLQNSVHKCPAPAGSPASPAYSVQH
ncbi:hypothetical protein J6590_070328, partial [Homalodisca vitripennis]